MASISALGVGSGLDLTGLLDQLRDAERGKLAPLTAQKTQQQAKISAYGQLQSALTTFQDSVAKLNEASLYQSLSANVRGDAFSATTSEAAQPGTYNVEVSQLATAGTLATQRVDFAESEIVSAAGKLELTFASGGTPVKVDIAAGSSLIDIRDAINAHEDAGVTASIINDGSGYRLALSNTESGAEASIESTNFAALVGDNLAAESGETIVQSGQDAALKINGVAITSSTNSVEDAIQGVTLNLQE